MENKLIITQGPPCSGKTTFAVEYQNAHPGVLIAERDRIRAIMFSDYKKGTARSKAEEDAVTLEQERMVRLWIEAGYTVIVSDTNTVSASVRRFGKLAKELGVPFEIKRFDTPLEVCLARNKLRPLDEQIPEPVIRRMHRRMIGHKTMKINRPLNVELNKRPAFVCDLDGTLELMHGRSPYDSMGAISDFPNVPIIIILLGLQKAYPESTFIFLSGRHDEAYDITYDALEGYGFRVDFLLMRETKDNRKDTIIKEKIYHEEIEPFFNVVAVFDDRTQVVDMWRRLGLHCLQVAEGNF